MTRLAGAVIATLLQTISMAAAEIYPSRAITMVVLWPAGGPADSLARIGAEHMRGSLAGPIVIENIAGAGGTIGIARVARAAPDGHTVILGDWNSFVLSGAVYPVQFVLQHDFDPVGLLASNPQLIVTRKSFPAKDFQELVVWLRANPERATGTGGPGSASHVCGVYLENQIGTKLRFVPYRGGAPLMQDLVGGQIDLVCQQTSNCLPLVRAGQVNAVAAATRLAAAPTIPTVDEAGVPGLYVSVWSGLWVPRALPRRRSPD